MIRIVPILRFLLGFLVATLPGWAASENTNANPIERKISLEEAIRMALEKNFLVRVKSFDPMIARAGLTEAWGRYDPKLTGTYQASRDELPDPLDPLTGTRLGPEVEETNYASVALVGELPVGTSYKIGGSTTNYRGTFNSFDDAYRTYGGVTLTQSILRGFGLTPGMFEIRIARTNVAMSEFDYQSSITNVITDVVYAYSNLYLAQAYLNSARRSRDMAVQLYKENEGRRQRGAMSEYDVLSARARVANREEYVLNAERGVRLAQNALKQLVSDERDLTFFSWQPAVEVFPPVSNVTIDAADGFRHALQNRPDFRGAQLGVTRSTLERGYYRNQLLPRVDLTGSYGYNGAAADYKTSRADARRQDYASYATGVSVSIPLTSAAERGRARAAKLKVKQAETDLQRLEQDILVDVTNAAQQVETTRQRVATTKTARDLNEEMLEAELKRLRAGTGSTFSVLYQQEQLSSAEIAAAQAQADHRKALAEYDRQIGRTLATHHIAVHTN
ncbi:MAG: TolC family protein [Nibricoccus sp.]